jgi:hypothetical protein
MAVNRELHSRWRRSRDIRLCKSGSTATTVTPPSSLSCRHWMEAGRCSKMTMLHRSLDGLFSRVNVGGPGVSRHRLSTRRLTILLQQGWLPCKQQHFSFSSTQTVFSSDASQLHAGQAPPSLFWLPSSTRSSSSSPIFVNKKKKTDTDIKRPRTGKAATLAMVLTGMLWRAPRP